MSSFLSRYSRWLHTCWPAGTVEKLPACDEHGRTNVPGVRIVGDLTGIPLLKFSADTAARAVREIAEERGNTERGKRNAEMFDIAIVGGGVAGISAAIEAKRAGLRFVIFEATEVFSTVANFPKAKPIYTYPTEMTPVGGLQFRADIKEALLDEMEAQRRDAGIEVTTARIERLERTGELITLHHSDGRTTPARRVIIAIGRSGNFRKLGCHGEDLPKVFNRLHDPKEFAGKNVLVVGGGDTALETAIALGACGAHVTLSYRKKEFSRPKPENIEKLRALEQDAANPVQIEEPTSERISTALTPAMQKATPTGSVKLLLGSTVENITTETVTLRDADDQSVRLMNDVVFTMLGREAPLDFFRRSGINIRGEWTHKTWISFIVFALFCIFLYHWKSGDGSAIYSAFKERHWFPFNVPDGLAALSAAAKDPKTMLGTLASAAGAPSFYYSLAYCTIIVVFGFRRIARRKTPYITAQTLSLMAVQVVPLFLLPYVVLPWMGANGWFDAGFGKWFADQFFPVEWGARTYWRAFGFILAWPLFIWNLFTDHPTAGWLVLSFLQTFVLIPLAIRRWGKGVYCGWICSCGALAETLGDTHRHKMPHGPVANRWNMTGQVILGIVLLLLVLRIFGWIAQAVPALGFLGFGNGVYYAMLSDKGLVSWFSYRYIVDLWLAGVVGVAAYFWFSGRVWCRFACPLAALMHIYARFSRYRIFAEKKKCISCNVCTSVCHQGIDVMNFANKGMPMEDPECVRCSACVQQCPTGVLSFGRLGDGGVPILDRLAASPVQMREAKSH
jgi:thioredoxin reductase/NAD-dependent dihydropyrimidine dehydrogenase PreA subunit